MFENLKGYGSSLQQRLALKDVRASAGSGYRGYGMAKIHRLTADWDTFVKNFNHDIYTGGMAMVARARGLQQNDPYARKILRTLEKNVPGPKGFLHRNKSGDYVRDPKTGEVRFVYDKLANLKIEEGFWDWSKKQHCTVSGQVSFRRLCQQAISTAWCDGEIFFEQIKGKSAGKYAYQLQPIDSMYVDYRLNKKLSNGNVIIMGIEVTPLRKPVAYWFRNYDVQKELTFSYSVAGEYKRIEADKIIHFFIQEIPGQIRGITQFAPAGIRLKMLYDFEENSLIRSKASSRVPGVIESQPNVLAGDTAGIKITKKDDEGNHIVELENGEFLKMDEGWTLKAFESDYPHQLHKEFTKVNLRGIAAGNDVGYSTISGDYENVTWHSGKLEKSDERDGFKNLQEAMIENFVEPVNYNWLEMALLSGAIKLPPEKIDKFFMPTFIGRGWEYTNPKEEGAADIEGLAAGIKTMEDVLAKRGIDIDEHFDQLAREAEKRKEWKEKFGVEFNWNAKPKPIPVSVENDEESEDDEKAKKTTNGNGKAHKEIVELLKDIK